MTLQMETSIPIQVSIHISNVQRIFVDIAGKEIIQLYKQILDQVLMRLQIILQLRPNPNIGGFFAKLPEVFLPVLWFDAEAAIDEEMASQVLLEKNTKHCQRHNGPRN